eukprot:1158716-Pelagomonas_calceolata.AAC.2
MQIAQALIFHTLRPFTLDAGAHVLAHKYLMFRSHLCAHTGCTGSGAKASGLRRRNPSTIQGCNRHILPDMLLLALPFSNPIVPAIIAP